MSAPEAAQPARVAVIAIGNALRGDDAAGLHAARLLRERGIDARCGGDDMLGLLDAWAGANAAVLLDALRSGAAPGTIVRFEAGEAPLGRAPLASTHAFGLNEAIELSRALGTLPRRVIVYAVEGARFDAGESLSPAVAAAVEQLASAVAREVEALRDADAAGSAL